MLSIKGPEPLRAMLSSPVDILLYAKRPFLAREGSTPSVCGELAGVLMVMLQMVNPSVTPVSIQSVTPDFIVSGPDTNASLLPLAASFTDCPDGHAVMAA